MKNLRKYFYKRVELIDIDGEKWTGLVDGFTPAIDSEKGIEEITLMTQKRGLIVFDETEIKEITILN